MTADWTLLQDQFYRWGFVCHVTWQERGSRRKRSRKTRAYDVTWEYVNDLGSYRTAGASRGGPLALIRNEPKVATLAIQSLRPTLAVYSCAGELLFSHAWTESRIAALGWTLAEELVCILEDGHVRLYNLQGEYKSFHLGHETQHYGVLQARVYSHGLVALTGHYKFVWVSDFAEIRPRMFPEDPCLTSEPDAWLVIPPQLSLSKHVEVILAANDTVFVLDSTACVNQVSGPLIYIRCVF
jgi:hypothetical protein